MKMKMKESNEKTKRKQRTVTVRILSSANNDVEELMDSDPLARQYDKATYISSLIWDGILRKKEKK